MQRSWILLFECPMNVCAHAQAMGPGEPWTCEKLPALILASAQHKWLTCGVGSYGNSVGSVLAGFQEGIKCMGRNNIFQVTPIISLLKGKRFLCWGVKFEKWGISTSFSDNNVCWWAPGLTVSPNLTWECDQFSFLQWEIIRIVILVNTVTWQF